MLVLGAEAAFGAYSPQAGDYLGRKQYAEAIGLLRACRESVPKFASTYMMLVQAHLGAGDIPAAEEALKQGKSVEAMLPWEPAQLERAEIAVHKRARGNAATMFGQAFAKGGKPTADKALEDLLKRRETGPVFDESHFNMLAYGLLKTNNAEGAVYVFEKVVQLYPKSWNAWDSLGEGLMKAGQKERAIESYRKSLELNPANTAGRAILKKLETGQ